MTNDERRKAARLYRQIRNGNNALAGSVPTNTSLANVMQTALPAALPKREGLRGKKYAFYSDRAPVPVVRREREIIPSQNTTSGQIGGGQGGTKKFNSYFPTHVLNPFLSLIA